MSTLRDAAIAYAERGWPIFPARADKTPYTPRGVMDATTNLQQIEDWWEEWPNANIALNVGEANMMVLDLDPGHSMEELEKNVGPIPETRLAATTPRGGKHLFFRIDAGELVSASASKLAPHVDVRSFHSYVLLAPSKTKDGSYHWDCEDKPIFRTDDLLRCANKGRQKHGDWDKWLIEPDLPENIAIATKWLKEEAKVAIEGQGGDSMAYATAAHLKSYGISEELAFDLIWEHWNPRCSPPWSADNIEHLQQKVENGYAYNVSPPGNLTSAYHAANTASLFHPVVSVLDKGYEVHSGRFRFVDEDGMSSIRPPEWLIEDLFTTDSYAMLFGSPSTFKTFIALDMALSIASGSFGSSDLCWPSPSVHVIGPVLFAAGEGRSDISKRVIAWQKRHNNGEKTGNFILGDPVPLVNEDHGHFLEGAKKASPKEGYKLVILDTVGRSMAGLNENAQEHASAFTNLVEHIKYDLDAAVLVLHHTGFSDQHRARGSSVFGADADTIIRLDRETKAKVVSLTMTKQKDAPEWEQKKYVRLDTVVVSVDPLIDSLVAVTGEAVAAQKQEKELAKTQVTEMQRQAIETAVIKYITDHPGEFISDKTLADYIHKAGDFGITSSTIRTRYIAKLKRNEESPAFRFYEEKAGHDKKGRWIYRPAVD